MLHQVGKRRICNGSVRGERWRIRRVPASGSWGFFYGKQSRGRAKREFYDFGDGHTVAESKEMKRSEDQVFQYRFVWVVTGSGVKGWITHYRPKNPPLSVELDERYAILAYGSNSCPDQLLNKNLTGVPVLYGRLKGAEAVYAGRKTQKGYVPATLARKKGIRSSWVTLLTREQLAAMDTSEGLRHNTYILAELSNVQFFVGRSQFVPLYTYVNTRCGVMTQNGKALSLRWAIKPIKPIKPIKATRPVKPIAPVGHESLLEGLEPRNITHCNSRNSDQLGATGTSKPTPSGR
jgi:hypothetical protein